MTQAAMTDDAILASVAEHGGIRAAASALGIPYSTMQRKVARAKQSVADAPIAAATPVAAPAVTLPPEMLSMLSAMAAALTATQKPLAPVVVPAEPSRELVRGLKARRKERAERKETREAAEDEKPFVGGTLEAPESREIVFTGRRAIITGAQNNSYVWPELIASMRTWLDYHRGELFVGRLAYNAKSYGQPKAILPDGENLWYAPEIAANIVRAPVRLAPDLVFCAEMPISPTAVDPLSGLESYTKSSSGIFSSTKHEMRSLAAMKGKPVRHLWGTGCITMPNYVPLKTGLKAEHHHVCGGLVVEVDEDGTKFVRQINAGPDGSFYDLDMHYTPQGVFPAKIESIMPGDIHRRKATETGILASIFGHGGIIDHLMPKSVLIEDLCDFTPRNHHNIDSPYFMARQRAIGQESVEDEMRECADFLRMASRPWTELVVVESNHDQAFGRWLENGDGHRDSANAYYWHRWNARVFDAIRRNESVLVFEEAVREHAPDLRGVVFLQEDDSYVVCPDIGGGIECGLHGHRGANGSRGSGKGYRVLGTRTNSAHEHTAGIYGGQYVAGVSGDTDMTYNRGPSSWTHSHIVTYPNSKRAIITQHGTRWRGAPVEDAPAGRSRTRARITRRAT